MPWVDGPLLIPVSQHKRLGAGEVDITPGARVMCLDGEIGSVERTEIDKLGQLQAFWVRAVGVFGTDMRIPAEWVARDTDSNTLRVAANRADIETYLGYESRARLAG